MHVHRAAKAAGPFRFDLITHDDKPDIVDVAKKVAAQSATDARQTCKVCPERSGPPFPKCGDMVNLRFGLGSATAAAGCSGVDESLGCLTACFSKTFVW